jgi:HAE1 family hydrophobic/amphiphilic exporter-1
MRKKSRAEATMQNKQSSFFTFTTRRPVAITMMVLAVVIFGLLSFNQLALSLMPDISYPSITVRTEYEGAAPEEVETVVSRPVEQELGVVANLQNITSISKAGQSDVILEFTWDTDINEAISDVREKLDQVFLPQEIDRPIILRYDPTLDPIMRIGIYGDETLFYLRRISEEEIKRALEQVIGVAAVKVKGGLEEEIRVELDEKKLSLTEISITQVKNRLSQENINLAGGSLKEGETEYLVRTLNEFSGVEEMQRLVVGYVNEAPVYLKDIARVYKTNKEREIVTKIDGLEAVEIEIYKSAEANVVAVAERLRTMLFGDSQMPLPMQSDSAAVVKSAVQSRQGFMGITGSLPAGVGISLLSDQSVFIENSLNEVQSAALFGGIFAILILLIFLRNIKSTVIVSLSIPISIVATFLPMNMLDVTLNIMSLGGLALGIGMLVDNSIVVLESIFRCREEGDSMLQATIRGTAEVGGAVTASTMTTIAVFFPIVFVKGVAGQVFGDMAITIVFSLLASLAVALVFIPMLASRELRLSGSAGQTGRSGQNLWYNGNAGNRIFMRSQAIFAGFKHSVFRGILLLIPNFLWFALTLIFEVLWFVISTLIFRPVVAIVTVVLKVLGQIFGVIFTPLLNFALQRSNSAIKYLSDNYYPAVLRRILDQPWKVIGYIFVPAALLGYYIFSNIGSTLLPEVHQGEFYVDVVMPVGTPVEKTAGSLDAFEAFLLKDKEVAKVATVAGTDKSATATADEGEHTARMTVRLKPTNDNERAENRLIKKVREYLRNVPGVQYKIARPVLFSFKNPIELQVLAYNLKSLRTYSEIVRDELKTIPALSDVKSSMQAGNPELQILFDRAKIANYGLNVFDVASLVRNKVRGDVATEFKDRDRKIDIRVKVTDSDKESVAALRRLRINTVGNLSIPLESVAKIVLDEGPSQIRRENQQRTALISANLSPGFSLSDANNAIEQKMAEIRLPDDMSWRVAGQNKEMETSLNSLFLALGLAIFLVYIVMASQFESFLHPFVIIFSIPLAFVGVLLFLNLLDIPLSVVVFLGLIMLAGIVVNNAIVLVDYINQLRARGLAKKEAVIQAGQARLRPILMTTLTTVLGLLPMAIGLGDGSEIRTPMAITVVSGLTISTLLTLVIIPTVYMVLDQKEEPASADQ